MVNITIIPVCVKCGNVKYNISTLDEIVSEISDEFNIEISNVQELCVENSFIRVCDFSGFYSGNNDELKDLGIYARNNITIVLHSAPFVEFKKYSPHDLEVVSINGIGLKNKNLAIVTTRNNGNPTNTIRHEIYHVVYGPFDCPNECLMNHRNPGDWFCFSCYERYVLIPEL